VTSVSLGGAHESAGLVAYLRCLVGLDDRGAVRLQGAQRVLGVWGGPPMDVVTLRPVALATELAEPLDVTVSARRMLEAVERVSTSATPSAAVDLPAAVTGPGWAGLLPPRGGWQELATVPAASVVDAVRVAVDGFRRRVQDLPEPERRSQPVLESVARQLWAQPVVAGIPLRAAHAAEVVGLLSRDGDVRAMESGPWQRLACPGGSVLLRRDGAGTGLGLDLGVWSLLTPTQAAPGPSDPLGRPGISGSSGNGGSAGNGDPGGSSSNVLTML
jgi:hypothetical protein